MNVDMKTLITRAPVVMTCVVPFVIVSVVSMIFEKSKKILGICIFTWRNLGWNSDINFGEFRD